MSISMLDGQGILEQTKYFFGVNAFSFEIIGLLWLVLN